MEEKHFVLNIVSHLLTYYFFGPRDAVYICTYTHTHTLSAVSSSYQTPSLV